MNMLHQKLLQTLNEDLAHLPCHVTGALAWTQTWLSEQHFTISKLQCNVLYCEPRTQDHSSQKYWNSWQIKILDQCPTQCIFLGLITYPFSWRSWRPSRTYHPSLALNTHKRREETLITQALDTAPLLDLGCRENNTHWSSSRSHRPLLSLVSTLSLRMKRSSEQQLHRW